MESLLVSLSILTTGRTDRVLSYNEDADGRWAPGGEPGPVGRWPTLSPSGDLYACSVLDAAAGVSRIEVREVGSHRVIAVPFASVPGSPAAIATRVPHYVSWSPDGRTLSFVAATAQGLQLFLAGSEALDQAPEIVTGAPLFSAWLEDSSALVAHHGDQLSVIERDTGAVRLVSGEAVGFRAPATGVGAHMAFCRREGAGIEVVAGDARDDASFRPVASYPGGVVVSFRPGTSDLTVSSANDPTSGVFDRLVLQESGSNDQTVLWKGPYVAAWWSPGGDRLVVVVPTQMGDGRYALYGLDPLGRRAGATLGLVPSEDTRIALGFFDQYFQSHCPWSPDGRFVGISGRIVDDAVSSSFGDPAGDGLLLWNPGPGQPLQQLGEGGYVSFPRGSQ